MSRFALLACLALAAPAAASGNYPLTLQSYLRLATAPVGSCSLCHTGGITGSRTVGTLFGRAISTRGASGNGNTTSLRTALAAMTRDAVDSDGDGLKDLDEVKVGRNPNVVDTTPDGGVDGGSGGADGGTPDGGTGGEELPGALTYGCGASVAPELASLALLAWLGRRRRRP